LVLSKMHSLRSHAKAPEDAGRQPHDFGAVIEQLGHDRIMATNVAGESCGVAA
jgi:hypothetical protein